jgi:hypothetical protein
LGNPSGYDALAAGNIWQNRIAEDWLACGFPVETHYGHGEPDIAVYFPESFPPHYHLRSRILRVVSSKALYLVPSKMRYGPEGKHSYATTRPIYRRDVVPEINYALANDAYGVVLTVVNIRNGVAEHAELDPKTFQVYNTSQRLNEDDRIKEYVPDLQSGSILEEDKEMGWTRITGFLGEPGYSSVLG